MLFEFKGKVYEINNFILFILLLLGFIILIYFIYLFGSIVITSISHNINHNKILGSDNNPLAHSGLNGKNLSDTSNYFNDKTNVSTSANSTYNTNQYVGNNPNNTLNNGGVKIPKKLLPKMVVNVLNKNPNATDGEICYFGGHGRVANVYKSTFNCRKTENLKIITLKDRVIYCCVTP